MTKELLEDFLRMWIAISEREKKDNRPLHSKMMWIQKKLVDVVLAEETRKKKLVTC